MLKRLLLAVLLLCACAAQAAVYSLPWGPKPQFVDANGAPMSGGSISTFAAGSSTAQVTYTDSTGKVSNPTTITLNVRGESPNEVWLTGGLSYKLVLKDSSGSTVWTVDNVSGVNDPTAAVIDEWKASGLTPTYVSATSFTFPGDQTVAFHAKRRLKSTNSGGTIYSSIETSSFGAGITTVTVRNDSGALDSGLSSVSYAIVSASNTSVPATRQSGTGAITRLMDSKLKDWIDVKDFGAICDKSTDDTTAIQAAVTYAVANDLNLSVSGMCKLTASVNIDRQVDGLAYDKYFIISGRSGGGFYITTDMAMFTSSIAFAAAPVSQLVYFDHLNLESNIAGASRLVLNNGRFLRTVFDSCSFDRINAVNSTIYTQTMYFFNNNIRRLTGTFFSSTTQTIDFKFVGNVVEAHTGSVLDLKNAVGVSIVGNLFEGISTTAIIYNGAQGLAVHGNYFEQNGKDIDGTGGTLAAGISLTGNRFSHVNAADYSVIWGSAVQSAVSIGNYHNGSMHNVAAGTNLLINDYAATSVSNNTAGPILPGALSLSSGGLAIGINPLVVGNVQLHTAASPTIAMTDNVLGTNYGGAIRGYGVGGQGGYVELGGYDAGAYTAHLTITQTGAATIAGSLPSINPGATTFANLGTPAAGTIKYCSDCTIANPCAAVGTGAIAKRLNGAWVCN